jgi:hypothetical protein
MASLEKSRNSLQTGVGVEPLFMLRCDRTPVMLTLISSFNFVWRWLGRRMWALKQGIPAVC